LSPGRLCGLCGSSFAVLAHPPPPGALFARCTGVTGPRARSRTLGGDPLLQDSRGPVGVRSPFHEIGGERTVVREEVARPAAELLQREALDLPQQTVTPPPFELARRRQVGPVQLERGPQVVDAGALGRGG